MRCAAWLGFSVFAGALAFTTRRPCPAPAAPSMQRPRRGTAMQRREGARSLFADWLGDREANGKAAPEDNSTAPVRATILGGGSFGLAMACVLARRGIECTMLLRSKEQARSICEDRRHPKYLSDIELPESLKATSDASAALKDADIVVHAVPVQYSRKFLKKVAKYVPEGVPVLCTSKGIERKTLCLMCEILPSVLGSDRSYAFLSGPSFAREMALGLATAVVVASDERSVASGFSKLLSSPQFRVFTSADVIGLEVGGATKNVLALAAGMSEGLGLGMNAATALVTRGIYEMNRIALSMGGRSSTIHGLSGIGDTFGTCFGPLSRNRQLGIRLGRGERLSEIMKTQTEVAEGVETAFALEELIKRSHRSFRLDLKFPIVFGVADILRGERTPREGLESLMLMPLRAEYVSDVEPRFLKPSAVTKEAMTQNFFDADDVLLDDELEV